MPNLINNIVSVGVLLKDGDEMESNLGIVNFNYKGTRINSMRSAKDGLYYLRVSLIQHKPAMTAMVYRINYDEKLKDTGGK